MMPASEGGRAAAPTILVASDSPRSKDSPKQKRAVRFGPTEYADDTPTRETPTPEARPERHERTHNRLVKRTPTGKFKGRRGPPSDGGSAAAAESGASAKTVPPPIEVALVQQDLQAHHVGPTFTAKARFERRPGEPMGLSILSGAKTDSERGSRIGEIKPGSCVTRCVEGCVLLDDRIVAINRTDTTKLLHEEVVGLIRDAVGTVTLLLERSTAFAPQKVESPFLVQHGTGCILPTTPSKKKKGLFSRKGSAMRDKKNRSVRGGEAPLSLKKAEVVTVHRHPNSNGLQIGIRGGVEDGTFPKILTAVHPRSPFAPLVEGGSLGNEYELLEINGAVSLGMPHDDLIQTLKDVGEEVQLKVIAPAMKNRVLAKLFDNPASDDATQIFMDRLRRAMYTRLVGITTEPAPRGGGALPGLVHVSEERFADLAKKGKLFEWVEHTNGHFYGLPKDAQARSRAAGPHRLARALDELYPLPKQPEPPTSPILRVSPPMPATAAARSDDTAAAAATAPPPPPASAGAGAAAAVAAEIAADGSATAAAAADDGVAVAAAAEAAEVESLRVLVDKMQVTTERLRSRVLSTEDAETAPASDPVIVSTLCTLRTLHVSCERRVAPTGAAPSGAEESPASQQAASPATRFSFSSSEKAAADDKFIFKAESPSLKKRQVPRDTSRAVQGAGGEDGQTKRSRSDPVVNAGEGEAAAAAADRDLGSLPLAELLAQIDARAQSIAATSVDTPAVTQHCHAIRSAVAAARVQQARSAEGAGAAVKPTLSQSGPVGVIDIEGGSDDRDSGVPGAESPVETSPPSTIVDTPPSSASAAHSGRKLSLPPDCKTSVV